MVIKLYKIDASPPVRAVLMTVDILELKIETAEVNIALGEQLKPEYVAKNPLHAVPLLEEGDFLLADSHAIITYLFSKYGADKSATYYPSDLRVKATVDQRLYFDATKLFPTLAGIFRSVVVKDSKGPNEEQIASVNESYGFTEKYLERSAFIAGEHLTVADLACVASISTLNVLVPIGDEYPKLKAWFAKIEEQGWYKRSNLPGLGIIIAYYHQCIGKELNLLVYLVLNVKSHDFGVNNLLCPKNLLCPINEKK